MEGDQMLACGLCVTIAPRLTRRLFIFTDLTRTVLTTWSLQVKGSR